MIKTTGDTTKDFIKTGGRVAEKMLTKSGDFATGMMKLTSKLSDDIGIMADRILKMADKIGDMAERIERTEALMAKMTAALANKDIEIEPIHATRAQTPDTVVLEVDTTTATELKGPQLSIMGNPDRFVLYVSTSPFFPDSSTIVNHIGSTNDYDTAWQRSINAISKLSENTTMTNNDLMIVVIAVKAEAEDNRLTGLSNSIDIMVTTD